mgnify:CR=1 FL=1
MNRDRTKTGLFMMEMILVILLFAVSAAVCMRIFGAADRAERRSSDISSAVMAAETAAEAYKARKGDLAQTAALTGGTASADTLVACYDESWRQCARGKERFVLRLEQRAALAADIRVCEGDTELFAITVAAEAAE